jgi:hypothetical protein
LRTAASAALLLAPMLTAGFLAIGFPHALRADSKRLTEDQRIELLRGLTAEYATIKTMLPRSKKPLEVTSEGTWDKAKWQEAEKELGLAGKIGDIIQVTNISVEKERIVLELNGGMRSKNKWYDHIQVGMGNSTRPITNQDGAAREGTVIALTFGGPIGETNSAEVKKMLQPVLDFEKKTVTENYVESLPEPIKEAIQSKKVIEGMNRDQVILAVGRPVRKSRETKDGTELEDWIYGEPPGRVSFVTFSGDKVVKVKETYAGLGGSIAQTPGANP